MFIDGFGKVDQGSERRAVGIESRDTHVADHDYDVGPGLLRRARRFNRGFDRIGRNDRAEVSREHQRRRFRIGNADHGDPHTAYVKDLKVLDAGQVLVAVPQIGGYVLEVRNIDQSLKMRNPAIEVVVAESIHLESHQVHRFDRRDVTEETGDGRRGADGIACCQSERIRIGGAFRLEIRRKDRGSADLRAINHQRIELTVPVRHIQDLNIYRTM